MSWASRYLREAMAWREEASRYPEGSRRQAALENARVYEELADEAEGGVLETQCSRTEPISSRS